MKRNFLILMLLSLLPMAGIADNIIVVPLVVDKTYGEADPGSAYGGYNESSNPNGVKTTMFYVASPATLPEDGATSPQQLTLEDIAKCLKVVRVAGSTGEGVGSYTYKFSVDKSQRENFGDHNILIQSNGDLNINPKAFSITATAANKEYDGTPTTTALAYTLTDGANTTWATILATSDLNDAGNAPKDGLFSIARASTDAHADTYSEDIVPVWNDNVNYDVTITKANYTITAKTVAEITFANATYSKTFGDGAVNWGLELAEGSELVGEETLADNFKVVQSSGTDLTEAKGSYIVKVVSSNSNYTLTSSASNTATYTINGKAINAEGVAIKNADALPDKTYKAAAWTLTVTDDTSDPENPVPAELQVFDGETRLVAGTDYTVTYEDNAAAGTAKLTITGAGNYETEATNKLEAEFTIKPATLHAVLAEPTQTISYAGTWNETVNITDADWKSEGDKSAFNTANKPVAAISGEDEYDEASNLKPGEHTVTISGGTAPTNYVFDLGTGTVTVGKANITLALKSGVTVEWNGTSTATDIANALSAAYTVTGSPVGADELFATQPTVISAAAVAAEYAPASYAITFQAHDATLADDYKDTYQLLYDEGSTVNFTITKKNLTITALNQAVAVVANAEDSEFDTTPAFGTTYTISTPAAGETDSSLSADLSGLTISTTTSNLTTAGEYTGGITISGASSDYYTLNYTAGNLTVTGDGGAITLAQNDEAEGIIETADGNTGVTVKFGARSMVANQWYTVVLPFATSPAELVSKLGTYVVVNRLSDKSSAEHVAFELEMSEIPAGEAFLLKTADNLDWNAKTFTSKEITKTISTEAKGGNKLVGVYKTTSVQSTDDQMIGWLGNKTQFKADGTTPRENKWYEPYSAAKEIAPFEAYLMYASGVTAAPLITVEEADGSTTAISEVSAGVYQAIKADGWYTVNGVKLQGAPTEKGIYINNGKKIIIK